jgi:CHAT domain-containing protein
MASSHQTDSDWTPWRDILRLLLALSLLCANSQITTARLSTHTFGPSGISQLTTRAFQETVSELKQGELISRELSGGAVDNFKVSVSANQYFQVQVEQKGIVVAVTLFSPAGIRVVGIESVSGAFGPIYVSEIAASSGDYRLEVRSSEKWANAGQYEVRLEDLRTPEAPDQERIAAERLFTEGQDLLAQSKKQTGNEVTESRRSALEKFKASRQHWNALGDHHGEVVSLYLVGLTYQRHLSQSNEAKNFMLQALALAPQLAPNDWRLEASIRNDLGVIYNSLYDEQNARGSLEDALHIYEAHHDRRGRASVYNNFGLVDLGVGKAREALEAFQIVLPIRQAEHDAENETITLNNLGGAYERLGEPRQSLYYYDLALQGWRKEDDTQRIATGLNNVALASVNLGLWQDALDYYKQALEIAQKKRLPRNEAVFLYNIGELYTRLNDPSRALESYQAALRMQQEMQNRRDEANLLAHIAQVYVSIGQPDAALENFNRALKLTEESQQSVESQRVQIYTLIGMGTFHLNRDLPGALQYYERAWKLSQVVGDRRQEAEALEKMGEAYDGLGDRPKALESFNSALRLRRALEDRFGEVSTLYDIAGIERDLNNLSAAAASAATALSIVESLRTRVLSSQLRTSYFATTQKCFELYIDVEMRLYLQTGREEYLAEALHTNERARARSLLDILAEASADIRRGVNPALLQKAQELGEKLSAKAQIREQLLNEEEVQQKSYGSEHKEEQLRTLKRIEQRLTNLTDDINSLTTRYDDARTQIRTNSPKYAELTQPQAVNLQETQEQLLDDNTLLLEYVLGDKHSYVWAVTPNSIEGFELLGRQEIESAAQRVTEALTARNREEKNESFPQRLLRLDKAEKQYTEASAALSKLVLEPVASSLGQKRLVIVADGALQLVPFSALPAPANSVTTANSVPQPASARIAASGVVASASVTLISRHEIVTLPSMSVLALQRRELANRKRAPYAVAVIADPVFDSEDERVAEAIRNAKQNRKTAAKRGRADASAPPDRQNSAVIASAANSPSPLASALRDVGIDPSGRIPRLGLSLREAMAIRRAAPANESLTALDFKASRETAMSKELSQYRIIHFATHGVLDLEHPELSGIVLSMVNEKGEPQDGYLRLHEIYNLNLPAELAVLSACQTGIGKQIKGEGLIALTRGFMYAGAKSVVASLWKVDDAATSELMAEFYKQMFTNKLKAAAALRAAQVKMSQEKRWQSPYYWAGFFIQGEWN